VSRCGIASLVVVVVAEAKETAADDQPGDDGGVAPTSHRESETVGEPPATSASAGSMTKGDEVQSASATIATAAAAGDEVTGEEAGKTEAAVDETEEKLVLERLTNCGRLIYFRITQCSQFHVSVFSVQLYMI